MLYYLLYNSSFIKKKKDKDKILYTLIGGSIIYIMIHAILSFSLQTDVSKYFWMIFLIDCSAIFISSDFQGFTSLNVINMQNNIEEDKNVSNNNDNPIIDEYIEKHSKKPILKDKKSKNIKEKKNKKPKKKQVSFQDSTPISILKNSNIDDEEEYDDNEALNINLTLENLENIDMQKMGSSNISDIQNNFLKKKMEDEYSDPGSDLDLDQFEKSISED